MPLDPARAAAARAIAIGEQRDYLLRVARSRLRDNAVMAEDAVQDTLLAALRPGIAFAEQSTLRTWLTGILINKIADAQRREWRTVRTEVGFDDADPGRHDDALRDEPSRDDAAIEWRDPERLLQGRQALHALRTGLASLPPNAVRALELREVEGWPHDAVARELGISVAQCSVLLHRARAQLRRELR
jgi:RNA polymerase sigma-70 factor (ECF subfamily)